MMIKETAQNKYGPLSNFLLFNACRLRIFRFRFFHDLDIKWVHTDTDLCANREHIGTVYEKLVIIGKYLHFIMNTFEDQMGDHTFDDSFFRLDQISSFSGHASLSSSYNTAGLKFANKFSSFLIFNSPASGRFEGSS